MVKTKIITLKTKTVKIGDSENTVETTVFLLVETRQLVPRDLPSLMNATKFSNYY